MIPAPRPARVLLLAAIAWPALHGQRSPIVRVDASTSAASDLFAPQAAGAADTVHAQWVDRILNPGSPSTITLHYNRSTDRGRTWQPADVVLHPGSTAHTTLVASGATVCSVFSGSGGALCRSSIDGGVTWRPASTVGPVSVLLSGLEAAISGSTAHVLWIDASIRDLVLYQRSTDGGLTWLPRSGLLSQSPGAGTQRYPRLRVTGNDVHVAWLDSFLGWVIHTRSLDGGLTWQPPVVASRSAAGSPDHRPFALAVDGQSVFVAHADAGNTGVSLVRSTNGGATWSGPIALGPSVSNGNGWVREAIHAAVDGNVVAVAWSAPGGVVANCSRNGGATWQPAPTVLDGSAGGKRVSDLAVRGGTVVACWENLSGGFLPGGCRVSDDAGLSWHPLATLEPSAGTGTGVMTPCLALLPESCVAVWAVQRPGTNTVADEIHATLLYGYQAYGSGIPGTGGVTPLLAGSTEPLLGNVATLALGSARGGSAAVLAATFAGPAAIPVPGGSVLVQAPVATLWGMTTGVPGTAGSGTFALPLGIPSATVLQAVRLNAQGFVLDPAAPGGFAATMGLELWTM